MAEQLSEQQQRESMEMKTSEIIEKNTDETVDDAEAEESDANDGLIITTEQEEEENSEKENQNHQELLLLQDITENVNKKIDDEIGSPKEGNNDDKKIFCGGISYETTQEDLTNYFAQFGPVKEAHVKYDHVNHRSRGFAFVEFESVEACKAALVLRQQTIKGRQCEIKQAKSHEIGYIRKKIFVGGLSEDFPEEELRKHFEQYGRVEEVEWPFNKQSQMRKNFAFVVFETEDAAIRAAANPKSKLADRECDVKKAVPQNKRHGFLARVPTPIGGFRANTGAYRNNNNNNYPKFGGGGNDSNRMRNGNGNGNSYAYGGGGSQKRQQMVPVYQNQAAAVYQMNPTTAWYNAGYNGGAAGWYGTSGATGGTSNNTSTAQWYNSYANNPVAAAHASQWYGHGGNWYNTNNGTVAASANGMASGYISGI